jgi:hypothetical protein
LDVLFLRRRSFQPDQWAHTVQLPSSNLCCGQKKAPEVEIRIETLTRYFKISKWRPKGDDDVSIFGDQGGGVDSRSIFPCSRMGRNRRTSCLFIPTLLLVFDSLGSNHSLTVCPRQSTSLTSWCLRCFRKHFSLRGDVGILEKPGQVPRTHKENLVLDNEGIKHIWLRSLLLSCLPTAS